MLFLGSFTVNYSALFFQVLQIKAANKPTKTSKQQRVVTVTKNIMMKSKSFDTRMCSSSSASLKRGYCTGCHSWLIALKATAPTS